MPTSKTWTGFKRKTRGVTRIGLFMNRSVIRSIEKRRGA